MKLSFDIQFYRLCEVVNLSLTSADILIARFAGGVWEGIDYCVY